ncbi:hypothetical protein EDB85DRAFT_1874207 [Lactarius pseudohatsudake]|nr:hypothetical protein EDB85DRAFT_1874207 [Lactarius pseudohatsudake]
MDQWVQLRRKYLDILLKMEGRPVNPICSTCRKYADIKCPDCIGANLFCKDCCTEAHSRSPFHRPLRWSGAHYTPVTLQSLGFALFLGHDGGPCPLTVENPELLKDIVQLPTPRDTPQPEGPHTAPAPSDSLYDVPDMPMDSSDSNMNRKRTADSGNPILTVVDRGGIFEIEMVFCVCSHMDDQDEQLLQCGMFPATFKNIQTIFTFSVLDDFLKDNLECKTTAQQYYSKLQSMTSKMFPNLVPNLYRQLLRASRQWRDLRNRMEQGLGHQPEGDAPDGCMAIFCPACPQPGINLPKDWKTAYEPYVLIRTFIMDGNFSAEHMKHRSGEKDVSLSAGMAFMANPDAYKAHLRSGKELAQPGTCNTYRAIEQANSSRAHLDITGIGATACCHGFFVPTSVVDFQKGEKQVNMDYSICKALSYNTDDIPVALVMYDIMCQYRVHFQERVEASPELSLPSSMELRMGIGLFHIHGHQDSCLPRFSPSYIPGAKQVDGEIIETLWAPLNNISRSLRGMSLYHRQEVLDAHMNHSNWKKLVRMVPTLIKRWKRLEPGLDASAKAYKALSDHFKHKTRQWLMDDMAAQEGRQDNPSSMDIYDTIKRKAPSRAFIQEQLIAEESGDNSIRGQTAWISSGFKIQEMQLAIRYKLRIAGSQITSEDSQIFENKRIRLQKLIDMFEHQADGFLLHHEPMDDTPLPSLRTYAEYDHVDDVDDSGIPAPILNRSDTSQETGSNAEEIPIILPSTLGWEWCIRHGAKSLAIKEAKLRYAQATDAVHKIRLALGFKSALFRTQVRPARSQQTKTRAWTAVESVETMVHEHARTYSMARDAFLKIKQAYKDLPELPSLKQTDLCVNTAILGSTQVGQRNKQLSWVWSFGISAKQDGTWMDECK